MSGFSTSWLALREPVDGRSRAVDLVGCLASRLSRGTLRILDLGAGTGANLRWLAPRLGGRQEWVLVDHDRRLLDALPRVLGAWAADRGLTMGSAGEGWTLRGPGLDCAVRAIEGDLSAVDRLPIDGCALVTASALLDLVGGPWLSALLARCGDAGAAVCFALTYDGRMGLAPGCPGDVPVVDRVNRHQRGDKGLGEALGPTAAQAAAERLAALGYRVLRRRSDWQLGCDDPALQAALIEGLADAARTIEPGSCGEVDAWLACRRQALARGDSVVLVGHQDLVAWPLDDRVA